MVREAEREPAATGTNATLIVQDFCGGTAPEAPVQLSVSEKSPAFEPENARRLMTGVPLPASAAVCGEEEELSATESEAEREPVAVGAKVMEMTQEVLGFKEPGQF